MPGEETQEEILTIGPRRASLLAEFAGAIDAYDRMVTAADYSQAAAWSERLAEAWRDTGELARLEQLGDQLLPDESLQLFSALTSSLILSRAEEARLRELRLGEQELARRFVLAGGEGIWADWEELMRMAAVELEFRYDAQHDIEVNPPKRMSGRLPTPGRRRRGARADELVSQLEQVMLDTRDFYYDTLDPDGRRLQHEELAAVKRHLEAGAACDRQIDLERYIWPAGEWAVVQLPLAELRSMQYSLLLAASEDPGRRAKAASADERKARAFVAAELASGASREEAVERLRAAIRTGQP